MDEVSNPILDLAQYFPYISLFMVIVIVFSIFYTRRINRILKEGLIKEPDNEVIKYHLKIAKIRQYTNYAMLIIIGLGSYFFSYLNSLP